MKRGIFIVIDGSDGSGKKTQTALLVEKLKQNGREVLSIAFPSYGEPSAGMVEAYLRGDFGTKASDINPYMASAFYAVDRFAQSFKIKEALAKGITVVADRFVPANLAHQGGKFSKLEDKLEYLRWQYDFEFNKAGLPKPDCTLILHVPTDISMRLVTERGNKKDIHEMDPDHLRAAESTYLEMVNIFPEMSLISCCKNGELLSKEQIHDLVWQKVEPLFSAM